MGQVSILEDVQKAIESAISVIEATIVNPTDIQVAAHERRLKREMERIQAAHVKILDIAKAIGNDLKSPNMDAVRYLLKIESEVLSLKSLRRERDSLKDEIRNLKIERDAIVESGKRLVDNARRYGETIAILKKENGRHVHAIRVLSEENEKLKRKLK
jgi:chromosome segregation ATPase